MRYLLAGLLLLLVSCAPPKSSKPIDRETLLPQLSQLPGVVASATEPLSFGYPEQVMFGSRAVLPMPGGPQLLNPLAQFLKQHPQTLWQVDLRVQTIYGAEYDQTLAEKRSELLASYLLSKGVNLQSLYFQPSFADGDPLVFTLMSNKPTIE
jgi:outer membrane protein OmpA-like peptidoglycan-associated protein